MIPVEPTPIEEANALIACIEPRPRPLEALTTQEVWQAADGPLGVIDEERSVLEFAARCQQEYLDARAALGPLLDEPVAFIRERSNGMRST